MCDESLSQLVTSLPATATVEEYPEFTLFNFYGDGFWLLYEKSSERITEVCCYGHGDRFFAAFRGTLPKGVTPGDTQDEIHGKLGKPARSGKSRPLTLPAGTELSETEFQRLVSGEHQSPETLCWDSYRWGHLELQFSFDTTQDSKFVLMCLRESTE
jgi:hypothetical protein